MSKSVLAAAVLTWLALGTAAAAQAQEGVRLLGTVPADVVTIAEYYQQDVYDTALQKIGSVADLLVDKEGLIHVAIVSVGGFLGLKSKHVAVPFNGLQRQLVENKPRVVLDTTQLALKRAPAFKYDRKLQRWERVED
jgi:sporulation protein YlmC with PRC-barrel domain